MKSALNNPEVGPCCDPVNDRQQQLTERLLRDLGPIRHYQGDPQNGSCTLSNRDYLVNYQARLQHYHLSLLHGVNTPSANQYYESSEDLDSHLWNRPRNEPDWKLIPLIRTYHHCRDKFSPAARSRVEKLLVEGRNEIGFGGTENHIINRATLVYLIDATLGIRDSKTGRSAYVITNWINQRGRRGFFEYNSPSYHRHSLVPLVMLFDLAPDADIREAAKNLLDVAFAAISLTTLNGYRGGPWHRATRVEEIHSKDADITALIGFLFFGLCPCPETITEGGIWVTTGYRPPEAVASMAQDSVGRGSYQVCQSVESWVPKFHAIHWVTPNYILASFTGAPPFTSKYYGSTNGANLQPWELTFGRTSGSIGPERSQSDITDHANTNTSIWQHQNVLLFRGNWAFYGDLKGEIHSRKQEDRWIEIVDLQPEGLPLFVRILRDKRSELGILEVAEVSEGWTGQAELARREDLKWAARLEEGGFEFQYQAADGRRIRYVDDKAYVDEQPQLTENFPLIDSPWLRSEWDSGKTLLKWASEELIWTFEPEEPGFGDGLNAVYQQGTQVIRRIDRTLDYNWGKKPPLGNMIAGTFQARWEGFFRAPYDGPIRFEVRTGGDLRLIINHKTLIDHSASSAEEPGTVTAQFDAIAGTLYPIAIHLNHREGKASMVARYGSLHEDINAMGLTGELFQKHPS